MEIVGLYSFNGGGEYIHEYYLYLLEKVKQAVQKEFAYKM